MIGRSDQSRTQYDGAQQAPVYAQAHDAGDMQPMDLVSPELGGMAQFEPSKRNPNKARKTGNGGDALVFIAMGLVSTALGLGLYAHVGIDITVALIAALGLFVSTSFLHVFVRRMQGVDILDRRVTALEDRVADSVPSSIDHVNAEAQVTMAETAEPAQIEERQAVPMVAVTEPTQAVVEEPVTLAPELPPVYTIPRDATGGFGVDQPTSSIADPIFDLTNPTAAPIQNRTAMADENRFEAAPARSESESYAAPQDNAAAESSRSIDGLVRQLSQGMSGITETAPELAPHEPARNFGFAAAEKTETLTAPVVEQFGQRAAPPVSRREAGETPLISMPQTAEMVAPEAFPADLPILGEREKAPNTINDPIGQAIHDAAARGDVDIYLQPILSIDDRKVRFFEVLGRVIGLGGDVIATEDHVELSRSVRASIKLDRAVMSRAARLLRKLSERRQAQPLFCNISRETLADVNFAHDFVEFMGGYRDLAPFLIFEIDHLAIVDADTTSINNIRALGAMGFRLSIDNVSNVEQALANGRELDVSFIKLPYDTFLPMQQNQADARARAATIQNVARDSGMTLIVDRIERKDQLAGVVSAGVNLGQGYLFSEPKPLLPQVAAEVADSTAAA